MTFHSFVVHRLTETYEKFELIDLATVQEDNFSLPDFSCETLNVEPTESKIIDETDNPEPRGTFQLLEELKKQNALSTHARIIGVFPRENENLQNIILKISEIIEVGIRPNDIRKIYRNAEEDIIIEFTTLHTKAQFLYCGRHSRLVTSDVIQLKEQTLSAKIQFRSRLTELYSQIWKICEMAKENGLIHSYWLTHHGMAVRRHHSGEEEFFLSPDNLKEFIYKY